MVGIRSPKLRSLKKKVRTRNKMDGSIQLGIKRFLLTDGGGEGEMDPKRDQIIKNETKTRTLKPIRQGASSRQGWQEH